MTIYTVKMINHAGIASTRQGEIEKALQAIFNEAFDKASDSVTVGWGSQAESDTIRMHHVESVADSVIVKNMPRPPALKAGIAGHTSHRGSLVGSEFYNTVHYLSNGKPTDGQLPALKTAGLVFHECLHNVAPDFEEKDIATLGGYGTSPPTAKVTDEIRDHLKTRITTQRKQLLVGK